MIRIIENPLSYEEFRSVSEEAFPGVVKGVVDLEKEIIAVGGEMHADEELILLEKGSKQENLWGINFHLDQPAEEWIVFDSMINIRPRQGNRSRTVESEEIQKRILVIAQKLVQRT